MKPNFFYIFLFLLATFLVSCSENKHLDVNDISDWFAFEPGEDFVSPSEIALNNWLDAPAGKHGFVQFQGENLIFEDGTPIKFWGTNICSSMPFVEAEKVDSFVDFLSCYGVNAVRFHKFTWRAYDGSQSTRFNLNKFKRLDYFQYKLRESGIYYGWSHIYGHKVLPGDSSRMVAYQEVKNLNYPWAHLNGTTSSLVNFASDLQDLNIALTVDMLNHVNQNTGLKYADDPALAFIEFQNEDDIFWGAIERSLEQAPTYRAMLCRMFSDWLLKKYKNQQVFENAWGRENIPEGESLKDRNIYPQPNHAFFSGAYESAMREKRPIAQNALDKMHFLFETQMAFYKKFEKAIRDTGYKGVLVGSCWQAGSGIAHLYNLYTDYEVGMIDRHNYFGGGAGGHRLKVGKVKNKPMLANPGAGLLSTGLQQVIDRPFSFSEWMSLVPNEWTAEAAPIIAVYGMGLQGWDASFSFATDLPRFSRYLQSESHGVYNATSPLHIGLYPALARMVYRGDIGESKVVATRNVHLHSLAEGKVGFSDLIKQGYDDKSFSGTVPPQALAIGRFPIQFTSEYEDTNLPDLSTNWDTIAKVITSVTGELEWNYGDQDYITVNTSATKGLIGFAKDQEVQLGDWILSTSNPFAVVFITSLSMDKDLHDSNKILVTTVARARNTGMEYNAAGDSLLAEGEMPLLMEPVNLKIESKQLIGADVIALDHTGRVSKTQVVSKNGTVVLDGGIYKTIYYLIEK